MLSNTFLLIVIIGLLALILQKLLTAEDWKEVEGFVLKVVVPILVIYYLVTHWSTMLAFLFFLPYMAYATFETHPALNYFFPVLILGTLLFFWIEERTGLHEFLEERKILQWSIIGSMLIGFAILILTGIGNVIFGK